MKVSTSGKAYAATISLGETPWARDMPELSGIQFKGWTYNGNTGVSHAKVIGDIRLQSYINCESERIILATPSVDSTGDDVAKVISSINAYADALKTPRSCEVDPATGHYPKPNQSEYDSDWI